MKILLFAAALTAGSAALAQQTVAPDNSAPARDARGIPVVSSPAEAPPGVNQPISVPPGAQVIPNPNQAQAFATRPAAGEAPPCSRTVTDGCIQTYERGTRPRRR